MRARLAARHLALIAVLALSAALNTIRLAQNGYANIFYSAGVKSMLISLHNFLFVSFDPGGLIMIDKPPLGLWLQVASAKLFGFTPLSLLLPEAIAGVLAVAALYWTITHAFGPLAALVGALALAVFPSFVAVSRDNNVDALLILLMILACGLALRAIESGRWRTLLACAAVVGLAFNTKTLAAYPIVPPIALAYLIRAPGPIARRCLRLLVAGLVMVAVSLAWLVLVDLTPASQRPYVGGSTDNSELGLTLDYNGFGRLSGEVGGPGKIPVVRQHPAAGQQGKRPASVHRSLPLVLANGRARRPTAFGGPTGPLRLFGAELGDQGAWMLPLALIGLLALALTSRRAPPKPRPASLSTAPLTEERPRPPAGGRSSPRLAGLLVLGGWFLIEAVILSLSKGIVHPYYVSALGPGSAAMVGAGALAFSELASSRGWRLLLVPLAVGATVLVQLMLLRRADYMQWFTPVVIALATLGVVGLLALRPLMAPALATIFGVLLLAPGVYAASTWEAPVQGTFPAAGPHEAAGPGGLGVTPASGSSTPICSAMPTITIRGAAGRS